MENLNIGDIVRFLDSVGGGKVVAFPNNKQVLIEDEDGFEIPVLRKELVLISRAEAQDIGVEIPKNTSAGTSLNSSRENTIKADENLVQAAIEASREREQLKEIYLKNLERNKPSLSKKDTKINPKISKPTAKKAPIIEVDLHIDQLISCSSKGMSNFDIMNIQLNVFHSEMKKHYDKGKGQRIVFIHGRGNGILRQAILKELSSTYPKAKSQDASFKEYGFGATLIFL